MQHSALLDSLFTHFNVRKRFFVTQKQGYLKQLGQLQRRHCCIHPFCLLADSYKFKQFLSFNQSKLLRTQLFGPAFSSHPSTNSTLAINCLPIYAFLIEKNKKNHPILLHFFKTPIKFVIGLGLRLKKGDRQNVDKVPFLISIG
jgi:hypothetical protein